MSSPAEQLPEDPQALRQAIAERDRQIVERDQQIADRDRQLSELSQTIQELQERMSRFEAQILEAQRARFGQRSERAGYAMADLFDPQEAPPPEEEADEPTQAPPATRSRKPKRHASKGPRPLPAHLPRQPSRHDYKPEDLAWLEQHYGPLEEIDLEITETLEYQPGLLYVKRHEVPKYAVTGADGERTMITPAKATSPIPGSQVGVTLLAHTLVSKYVDHLPLNRISEQFARDGLRISRQRLCDYSLSSAEVLRPIAEQIHRDALACEILHSDDTTLAQQEQDKRKTRTARLWAYLGRGRSDGAIPVSYCYTQGRSQEAVLAELAGFRGYLQADAFIGYLNAEAREPGLSFVACLAHARRRFEKVARQQKTFGRAHRVMKMITALYQIEGRLRDRGVTDPQAVRAERQARSVPILRRLRRRLERMAVSLPPKSDLGEATNYALNHWQALTRYTEDGRLEPDNNRCERALRGVCVGRKNWNFVGNERGGRALATLLTILETCKQNGINPREYLIDVLTRIHDHRSNRVHELLPYHWTNRQVG